MDQTKSGFFIITVDGSVQAYKCPENATITQIISKYFNDTKFNMTMAHYLRSEFYKKYDKIAFIYPESEVINEFANSFTKIDEDDIEPDIIYGDVIIINYPTYLGIKNSQYNPEEYPMSKACFPINLEFENVYKILCRASDAFHKT